MSGAFTINYPLSILWLLHSCLVLLLAYINPNHYTTIDSHYYLQSASNMLAGHGYTILEGNEYQWNGTFPIGYPAAISMVSSFTKINTLWSSKLVNISASGIWLFFINQWFGKRKSVILGYILFLGSFLKLWAHTWSESLFLIILFCWVFHFYHLVNSPGLQKARIIYVLFLGLLLMLMRYAGIFIIPLTLCCAVFWIYKNEYRKSLFFGLSAVFWLTGFISYLYLNKYQSGEWYGGNRFEGSFSIFENIFVFLKGLLNELLLIPDIEFKSSNVLFWAGVTFQILIIILLRKYLPKTITVPDLTLTFWVTAFSYLIFLFTLRIFSHFDEPGFRILAPFTFLILCGLLHSIPQEKLTYRLQYLLTVFVMVSWLEIIPRDGLQRKVKHSIGVLFKPNP
jgi:hypothetical protein